MGGVLEDDWVWFWLTDFTRDDDLLEESIQLECAQEGAQSFIPIGNHDEREVAGLELGQGWNDISVHMPCGGLGKPAIQLREKGSAWCGFNQSLEGLIDYHLPIRTGMKRMGTVAKCGVEPVIQQIGAQVWMSVQSGDFSVEVTDGRVRIDQRGSNVEGDRLEVVVEPQVGGTGKLNPPGYIHGWVE
jgi:hypothetical protein